MKYIKLTDSLFHYVTAHTPLPHPLIERITTDTAARSDAAMQISHDQACFLKMLVKMARVERAVEVGCFTGTSAIAIASGLPENGRLITLDINPDTARTAQGYFRDAGLADKIELRLGPAAASLDGLLKEFGEGSFGLAFIDADKANYDTYYEKCLKLLKVGGLVVVDNVLWSGRVIEPSDVSTDTVAIRKFNEKLRTDSRVEGMMLAIADGIYVCRKL